ncbi:hypothetical protein PHAVU_007G105600 [Phaseolus vulgaris]|uniref:Transmembrane protein n=1 Tax=Phaseolus vulgaris TaxID=3885 RepID=V7BG48_PHAVU|nr:hypothetical protein PHAVU_007G105600g [Phaseolus vulgaris]ESW15828.1 hypothetical protein PHAVU_007G105600g [Phaseolus vulgaris]
MNTDTEEQPPKHSPPNLFSLFPKIHFQFPFLPLQPQPSPPPPPPQSNPRDEAPNLKSNVVRFPKTQAALVSSTPLQAEIDASNSPAARTTNPLLLWQIYALGTIAISTWVWARWNERKGRGGSPGDERRPSDNDNH